VKANGPMPPTLNVMQAAPQICPEVAHHWWTWYPPVGTFIAVVALLTFIYSVRYDGQRKIRPGRKKWWFGIIALLVALELRSVGCDRADNTVERAKAFCEQTNKFAAIANQLTIDIDKNQRHFDQTMSTEGKLQEKANSIGILTQRGVEDITGGRSYAYAYPLHTFGSGGSLIVYDAGSQPLLDVQVIVEEVFNDCPIFEEKPHCGPSFDDGMMHRISLGSLGPRENTSIPKAIQFPTRSDGSARYNVRVFAQNGQTVEELFFRRGKQPNLHEFRFQIFRRVHGKRPKNSFKDGDYYWEKVRSIDWTNDPDSVLLPDDSHP
jgi:hypothetical protein